MILLTPRGNRSEAPRAPAEIADAVELYARQYDRTGKIEFAVGPNTWLVRLSLRPNDPRLLRYQQGMAPEPPTEVVWLQEPNPDAGELTHGLRQGPYRALDIHQMGAAGVRAFLERGNTFSGRGEFSSPEDAFRKTYDRNEESRVANRARIKEETRLEFRDERRRYVDVPMVSPGIDLKQRVPDGARQTNQSDRE